MRRRLFALLAMVLGFSISFLAIEAALRMAPPSWLRERMRELNAGVPFEIGTDQGWPLIRDGGAFLQFVPDSSFVVRNYEYEHIATIDELGGRSTTYATENDARIVLMGDSFTFGIGVDDSSTFASRLGEQSSFRFVNLGVPGSALPNQLDILDRRHVRLGSPEIYVFFVFMGNDLADIRSRYERPPIEGSDETLVAGPSLLWRINDYVFHEPILKQIYTIQLVRQKLLALANRDAGGRMNPVFQSMRTGTNHLEASVGYLRQELKRLTDMSRHHRFNSVFVLLPDVHQISPARFEPKSRYYSLDPSVLEPKRVSREISAALREFDLPYIDITRALRALNHPRPSISCKTTTSLKRGTNRHRQRHAC